MRRTVWWLRQSWGPDLAGAPHRPPPWSSAASGRSSCCWWSWWPDIKSADRGLSTFTKTSHNLSGKIQLRIIRNWGEIFFFQKLSKLSNLMSWKAFQNSRRSSLVFHSLPVPRPSELPSPSLHHWPPPSLQSAQHPALAVQHQTPTGLSIMSHI